MSDTFGEDLFGAASETTSADAYAQDGPDLFGMEPDELILPAEPDPIPDPDVDVELDSVDEIPIDPDDEPDTQATAADVSEADVAVLEAVAAVPLAAPAPQPTARTAPDRGVPVAHDDAPLALYRRYRPETFAQVIGQDHVTEPLQRALVNNRVNHAYLFSGPRGCGKTSSARILARCLNCEQGPTPTPCGVCQSCRDLARGGAGSIDVIEIDAASHGGVNEARDLRERAFFAPVHSRYKIYIIDEAHMVTKEGFNALLKLVEEPPPHVKFIFATTEPEKVLGTIRSRTHHYPFRLVPPKVLASYLEELCDAEGVAVDKTVLPLVVRAGAGSVRDSLSVLDQLLGGAAESGVSYRQATALLGYTPDTLLDEIMDAFAAGDASGVFACVDKVIEVGQDPRRFAEDLLRRLRDLIIVAAVPDALTTGLVDVAGDQAERLTVQARGMGAGELARAAEVLAKGLTEMRGTTAPRLHLELMCARVLLPGADVDARGIHARLDRLERRLNMVGDSTHAPAPRPDQQQAAPAPDVPRGGGFDAARAAAAEARRGASQDASRGPASAGGRGAGTDASRGAAPDSPRGDAHHEVAREGARPAQTPEPRAAAAQAPDQRATRPAADDWPEPRRPAQPASPDAHHAARTASGPDHRGQRPADSDARGETRRDPRATSGSGPSGADRVNVERANADRDAAGQSAQASGQPPQGQVASDAQAPEQNRPSPAAGVGSGGDPGTLAAADVRRMWPQVLDAVKVRRRVTWIVLSQNAQVHDFADGVLTLGMNSAGAKESFGRGGSPDILREAIIEVLGIAPRIEAVVSGAPITPPAPPPAPAAAAPESRPAAGDPQGGVREQGQPSGGSQADASASQGGRQQDRRPAPPGAQPPPEWEPEDPEDDYERPNFADLARENIRQARTNPQSSEPEIEQTRDDVDLDANIMGVDELLTKELGARLIAEEPE